MAQPPLRLACLLAVALALVLAVPGCTTDRNESSDNDDADVDVDVNDEPNQDGFDTPGPGGRDRGIYTA